MYSFKEVSLSLFEDLNNEISINDFFLSKSSYKPSLKAAPNSLKNFS
jgi:hypothetical protein